MQLSPYLTFGGNCAEAFEFYRQQLNGKKLIVMPFRGSPMEENIPENWRDKTMHASLDVDGHMLLGSDGMPGQPFDGVKGCSMSLNFTAPEEAETVFNALAQNGKITMPLQATFWASKFGMLVDQFGVSWMFNCETPQ